MSPELTNTHRMRSPKIALAAVLWFLWGTHAQGADSIRALSVSAEPGQGGVAVPLLATHDDAAIVGFSLALAYDKSLVSLSDFSLEGTATGALQPEYVGIDIHHDQGYGALGVIFQLGGLDLGTLFLGPATNQHIATAYFEVSIEASSGSSSPVDLEDGLGSPPIRLQFLHAGLPPSPVLPVDIDGRIYIVGLVPPQELSCRYDVHQEKALLSWSNGSSYDQIKVERDDQIIGVLSGTATTYEDSQPPSGLHSYRVIGVRGDTEAPSARCLLSAGRISNTVAVTSHGGDAVTFLALDGTELSRVALPAQSDPLGVAVDLTGAAWVAASGADAVYRIDPEGQILQGPIACGQQPKGVAVTPKGDAVLVCGAEPSLTRIAPDGTVLWGGDGIGDSPEDGLRAAVPLAEGAEYIASGPLGNLWVSCTAANRLIRVAPDGGTFAIDLSPLGNGPRGVAVDRVGQAWVAVAEPPRLLRVSFDGLGVRSFAVQASPEGVAIDGEEHFWLTHAAADQVSVWDREGNRIQTISLGENDRPTGIAIDGTGTAWATCSGSDRVARIHLPPGGDPEVAYFPLGAECRSFGDMTGFALASVGARSLDLDGDSYLTGEEIAKGANPFDPGSIPPDIDPTFVAPVAQLSCIVEESDVLLSWENREAYDQIEISRNGVVIATLPGERTSLRDSDLPPGGYHYAVVAVRSGTRSESALCLATLGDQGDAQFSHESSNLVDIAVFESGARKENQTHLYILDRYSSLIEHYENTEKRPSITSPFGNEGISTGIAPTSSNGSAALAITGSYDEEGEVDLFLVTDLVGKQLALPVELRDGAYSIRNAAGLDYDPTSGLYVILVEPEDPDIYTFRYSEQEGIDFIEELCVSNIKDHIGITEVTGIAFSPYHASGSERIYLLLTAREAEGALGAIEVVIEAGTAARTDTVVGITPETDNWRGIDTAGSDVYVGEPLEERVSRFSGVSQVLFVRGDANEDNRVDIGDAIAILTYLFAGGEEPACLKASDANDDGAVDVGDPISLLAYLFAGGSEPPVPFGECGADPTPDDLSCLSFGPCQ